MRISKIRHSFSDIASFFFVYLTKEFKSHLHVITSALTPYALGDDERAEKVSNGFYLNR